MGEGKTLHEHVCLVNIFLAYSLLLRTNYIIIFINKRVSSTAVSRSSDLINK